MDWGDGGRVDGGNQVDNGEHHCGVKGFNMPDGYQLHWV